ncbi:glycosyltransferase [Candidatus Altiarchaeota archaeon]
MLDTLMWAVYFSALYLAVFWLLVLLAGREEELEEIPEEELPRVSVVVPAYNEEDMLAECVESLLKLDYPGEKLEIIVVNDGSTDKTREIAESFGEKIKLINLKKNSGTKAIPLNVGLRKATGEFVACLDADSVVGSSNLKNMLRYFQDERVAAVTPALKVYHPKNLLQKLQWFEYIFAIFLRKYMAAIDSIYVTPGPFTVYRRQVLLDEGGFDEENITEDMEIALRLQYRQHKIANAFDANVYSLSPDNLSELYQQRRRWYHGLLSNSIKYKKLFFNRSYGDFGILMPLNVFSVIILMVSTFIFTYYSLKPFWAKLVNFYLIDFDLWVLLQNLNFNLILLDLDYTKLWIVLAVLAMGIVTLIISHRISTERIRRYGFRPLVAFMLFYFLFLGYVWIGVVSGLAVNRRRRW